MLTKFWWRNLLENGHLENREGDKTRILRQIQANRLRGWEVNGTGSVQHPIAGFGEHVSGSSIKYTAT